MGWDVTLTCSVTGSSLHVTSGSAHRDPHLFPFAVGKTWWRNLMWSVNKLLQSLKVWIPRAFNVALASDLACLLRELSRGRVWGGHRPRGRRASERGHWEGAHDVPRSCRYQEPVWTGFYLGGRLSGLHPFSWGGCCWSAMREHSGAEDRLCWGAGVIRGLFWGW